VHFTYNPEKFLEHYHQKSNVETAYSMIKGKFGSALRSKRDTGQINEALCKVLAHNVCEFPAKLSLLTARTHTCSGMLCVSWW